MSVSGRIDNKKAEERYKKLRKSACELRQVKVSKNSAIAKWCSSEKVTDPRAALKIALMSSGLNAAEAVRCVDGIEKPSARRVKRAEEMFERFSLAHPELVNAAQKVVKDAMEFKPKVRKGKVITPTYAQALEAAKMVLDRADPVINRNLNVNINVDPVDLSRYREPGQQEVSTIEVDES